LQESLWLFKYIETRDFDTPTFFAMSFNVALIFSVSVYFYYLVEPVQSTLIIRHFSEKAIEKRQKDAKIFF